MICLLSALQFHEIGTQLPNAVWIALPEGTQTPTVTYPPLRIARLRGAGYTEGIETVMDQGSIIRVYGIAETVTDCFKFRNKIGLDVALEALKDAWRQRRVAMDDMLLWPATQMATAKSGATAKWSPEHRTWI